MIWLKSNPSPRHVPKPRQLRSSSLGFTVSDETSSSCALVPPTPHEETAAAVSPVKIFFLMENSCIPPVYDH